MKELTAYERGWVAYYYSNKSYTKYSGEITFWETPYTKGSLESEDWIAGFMKSSRSVVPHLCQVTSRSSSFFDKLCYNDIGVINKKLDKLLSDFVEECWRENSARSSLSPYSDSRKDPDSRGGYNNDIRKSVKRKVQIKKEYLRFTIRKNELLGGIV